MWQLLCSCDTGSNRAAWCEVPVVQLLFCKLCCSKLSMSAPTTRGVSSEVPSGPASNNPISSTESSRQTHQLSCVAQVLKVYNSHRNRPQPATARRCHPSPAFPPAFEPLVPVDIAGGVFVTSSGILAAQVNVLRAHSRLTGAAATCAGERPNMAARACTPRQSSSQQPDGRQAPAGAHIWCYLGLGPARANRPANA